MGWVEPRSAHTRDGVPFTVRTVEEEDAAALLEHGRSVAGSAPYDIGEADEFDHTEASEREWIKSFRQPDNSLIIAGWHEGRVIALLHFQGGKRRKMAHSGHFGIGVGKDWRGRGVGSVVLDLLICWARAHSTVEEITLGVVAENEGAIRLYRRHGFVEIGRHPGKFRVGPGRYWTDVQMSLWVKGGPDAANRP